MFLRQPSEVAHVVRCDMACGIAAALWSNTFKISAAVGLMLSKSNLTNEIKIASILKSCRRNVGPTQYKENGWPYVGICRPCWVKNVKPTLKHLLAILRRSDLQNDVAPFNVICQRWAINTSLPTKCHATMTQRMTAV